VSGSKGEARVEHFEGGSLSRAESDQNGDGKPDLWNYYGPGGKLVRQEQDQNFDGKLDTWVTLDPDTGKERMVERDANGDGVVESRRENDAQGNTTPRGRSEQGRQARPHRDLRGGQGRALRGGREPGGKIDKRGEFDADGKRGAREKIGSDSDGDFDVVTTAPARKVRKSATRAATRMDVVTILRTASRSPKQDATATAPMTRCWPSQRAKVAPGRDSNGDDVDSVVTLDAEPAPLRRGSPPTAARPDVVRPENGALGGKLDQDPTGASSAETGTRRWRQALVRRQTATASGPGGDLRER
jgi:hypothetical protein